MYPEGRAGLSQLQHTPETDGPPPGIALGKTDEQLQKYPKGSDVRGEMLLESTSAVLRNQSLKQPRVTNEQFIEEIQRKAANLGSQLVPPNNLAGTEPSHRITMDQRCEFGELLRHGDSWGQRNLPQEAQCNFLSGMHDQAEIGQDVNQLLANQNFGLYRNTECLPQPQNYRRNTGDDAHPSYEDVCTPRPRWCPTQEQIQFLESLFNSGTTTPSRDMIVEIAAQLRKYGSIAEANVFYWFQNRKARAKRKMRIPAEEGELGENDAHTKSRKVSLKACSGVSSRGDGYQRRPPASMNEAHDGASMEVNLQASTQQSPTAFLSVSNSGMEATPRQETMLGAAGLGNHINFAHRWTSSNPANRSPSWPTHFEQTHDGSTSLMMRPLIAQHKVQLDPRVCLSLAPPAQQGAFPRAMNYYHGGTASDQFLQAAGKGVLMIDDRQALSGHAMFHNVNPSAISHDGNRSQSNPGELSRLPHQSSLPLPLVRTDNDGAAARLSVPKLGEGQEQVQLWEELDPCTKLIWGGHNQA